eukprot:1181221-Prorocentrum_minimum.AAC.3
MITHPKCATARNGVSLRGFSYNLLLFAFTHRVAGVVAAMKLRAQLDALTHPHGHRLSSQLRFVSMDLGQLAEKDARVAFEAKVAAAVAAAAHVSPAQARTLS